jgi:adenylate cyclase
VKSVKLVAGSEGTPGSSFKLLYLFEDYALDTDRRELRRGAALLSMEPQVFDLLVFLVGSRDRVVSKDDLLTAVWGGRIVSESTIATRINAVRRVIGDSGEQQRLIRTIIGKGVRFVGAVREARKPVEIRSTYVEEDRRANDLVPPDKPSVAVLPFTNMSGNPEQEFVADGIAEDIITALSRCPWLLVIARNSSFTYRGRAVDLKQVGHELGARYVLEGSVRSAGNRLRVSTQLVEAETGNHIWANRYDRDLADIFAVQDEITESVTIAIAPAVAEAELRRAMRKPPESLNAWSAYQRGLWHLHKFSSGDNTRAQAFFREAIDLDPTFAAAYTGLAWAQSQAATTLQTHNLAEANSSAEALARRAIMLDPADAEAHSTLGLVLWLRGDREGAVAEARQALALSPNLAFAHALFGATLIFSGQPREGVIAIHTAIRLDPNDPMLPSRLNHVALGHYFCREYDAAVEAAKQAIRSNPDYPQPYRWLAAGLGQIGRIEEAKEALEKVSAASFDMYVRGRVPWMRPEDHAHMVEGLRKAGWTG